MGMHKLGEIVKVFQTEQKGDLPVGIIHKGSTVNEKIGLGTINTIEDVVAQKHLKSPAIIIIGEVVQLHKEFI